MKIKKPEKVTKVKEYVLQYWEMGLLFYYIPRSQTTPPGVIHLYTIQTAKIWSLHLEILKVFEKN